MSYEPHATIDFETFSAQNIRLVGAPRYARDETTEVLVLSYKLPGRKLKRWVPSGVRPGRIITEEQMEALKRDSVWPNFGKKDRTYKFVVEDLPEDLLDYVANTEGKIEAHNAAFEMDIWENVMVPRYGAPLIRRDRWRCSAAKAAAAGLPRSLGGAGAAMHLSIQKDSEGTRLLNKFAKPRRPSKNNPSTRTWPWDEPEEFESLCKYCDTDVLSEEQLSETLPDLPPYEWRVYLYDMAMNQRGLPFDTRAVRRGLQILQKLEWKVKKEVEAMTGGIRATQRDKMLEFLQGQGVDLDNLQAKTIKDLVLLRKEELSEDMVRLLQLRIEGGKASTKKLKKILEVLCEDGVARGCFLYHGATTGRWAGKLVQPQNFIRGEWEPWQIDIIFQMLAKSSVEEFSETFEWPIDALAQAMRGFIKAQEHMKLVVCDFSAIEARVLAWVAGNEAMLDRYRRGDDVYKHMAMALYRLKSLDEVDAKQRKMGKDIVLGCGYQMGGPGFAKNCLMRGIVIEDEEAARAVRIYREENPSHVQLWYDTERAACDAVEDGASADRPVTLRNLQFFVDGIWFCIRLPSGRCLRYPYPKVDIVERWGKPTRKLTFRSEVKGKWIRESTYGGKLVENIVQAISRDIMVYSWLKAEKRGYKVIGTVHDELITLVPRDFGSDTELEEILKEIPAWAKGAPISAEGWQGNRYRK